MFRNVDSAETIDFDDHIVSKAAPTTLTLDVFVSNQIISRIVENLIPPDMLVWHTVGDCFDRIAAARHDYVVFSQKRGGSFIFVDPFAQFADMNMRLSPMKFKLHGGRVFLPKPCRYRDERWIMANYYPISDEPIKSYNHYVLYTLESNPFIYKGATKLFICMVGGSRWLEDEILKEPIRASHEFPRPRCIPALTHKYKQASTLFNRGEKWRIVLQQMLETCAPTLTSFGVLTSVKSDGDVTEIYSIGDCIVRALPSMLNLDTLYLPTAVCFFDLSALPSTNAAVDFLPQLRTIYFDISCEFIGLAAYAIETYRSAHGEFCLPQVQNIVFSDMLLERWTAADFDYFSPFFPNVKFVEQIPGWRLWPREYKGYSVNSCKVFRERQNDFFFARNRANQQRYWIYVLQCWKFQFPDSDCMYHDCWCPRTLDIYESVPYGAEAPTYYSLPDSFHTQMAHARNNGSKHWTVSFRLTTYERFKWHDAQHVLQYYQKPMQMLSNQHVGARLCLKIMGDPDEQSMPPHVWLDTLTQNAEKAEQDPLTPPLLAESARQFLNAEYDIESMYFHKYTCQMNCAFTVDHMCNVFFGLLCHVIDNEPKNHGGRHTLAYALYSRLSSLTFKFRFLRAPSQNLEEYKKHNSGANAPYFHDRGKWYQNTVKDIDKQMETTEAFLFAIAKGLDPPSYPSAELRAKLPCNILHDEVIANQQHVVPFANNNTNEFSNFQRFRQLVMAKQTEDGCYCVLPYLRELNIWITKY